MREGTVVQFSSGRVGRLLPSGKWQVSGLGGETEWNDPGMIVLWVPPKDVSDYALGTVLLVADEDGVTYPMMKDGHTIPGGGSWSGPYGEHMVDSQIAETDYTMIYGGQR